jgi:hypothetical protein
MFADSSELLGVRMLRCSNHVVESVGWVGSERGPGRNWKCGTVTMETPTTFWIMFGNVGESRDSVSICHLVT